ncbi:ARS binding protein 2-domain-containing protein [Boeremia exigua]|uniref:ARS binding protein 2-domain-containing protein n=1 Tax=Boeremia exigua TaxID=749465 RepID=UPI001E8D1F82|nr:ARS binding protein 2-domain-containing protein [Boeremia exigua]KAH6642543.1 ARS binding protein 2-domain-containing protein [Boeremia exigua]
MQVDYGDANYEPFRHPSAGIPAIDPALERNTGNRNGHAPMAVIPHAVNDHLLQPDNASLSSAHLAHGFYGDMTRTSQPPSTPSNASPRFSTAVSPNSQTGHASPGYAPDDRGLPPQSVSDDTIDDAFASFILYCNPSFALSIDTSELVKLFRTPPKSDGNAFSTWTLFELIGKFSTGEIKTWTQLALDLGVSPPDTDKGQSTQKVQQYSVRLKRWMRAMHIDAFFEYMLGKQHPYYLQIPPPHDPFPEEGRDGVPLEEDLALRALDPKFKPKRGRRKADDADEEMEAELDTPARKRPQLDTSIPFGNALQPQSAYPTSAHPNHHMGGFLTPHDPWTAASAITPASVLNASHRMKQHENLTPYSASPMSGGQQLRWRLNSQEPATPHPLSAVTPSSAHHFFDEPHSAITPSSARPRARRRHGPAVSSAWSASSTTPGGKPRGRPPSNRSTRDGPFVTFPVNPSREGTPVDVQKHSGALTPIVERPQSRSPPAEPIFRFPPTPASAIPPSTGESPIISAGGTQRQRLSLQVPQNIGNPVRLITPTVLVNGEEDPTPSTAAVSSAISFSTDRSFSAQSYGSNSHLNFHGHFTPIETPARQQPPPRPQSEVATSTPTPSLPSVSLETLNRALAAELIRAPLTGRRKRLRGTEAKSLASAVLLPLYAKPSAGNASSAKVMSDQVLGIAISSCLGLSSATGIGLGGPSGGVKRIECVRFRVGGDGYESPIEDNEDDAETINGSGTIKETFDISFAVSFGGLSGEWTAKGLHATAEDADHRASTAGAQETDRVEPGQNATAAWRAKFQDAQRRLWESQEEVKNLKEKILEAVL